MFIVEGLDYAGKTTALNRIQRTVKDQRWARWYGGAQVHEVQRWGKLPKDFDYCASYIVASSHAHPQLCDRFVLSELAYGEVFRGGPNKKFDTHARRRVQRALNANGTVTLLVKADWESTERRAKERCLSEFDAAMKVRQTFEAGTKAFQNALADITIGRHGGSFLGEYDTSDRLGTKNAVYDEMIEWYVEQWHNHLARAKLVKSACPQSWGYLWPKILFVGENINHPSSQTPFGGEGGASRAFTDLLDQARIGEKELYIWNAFKFSGAPLLTREGVAILQPRIIVALGKMAHEHLQTLGIKHVEFPHPQWIGQFHKKEMGKWATELRSLVLPVIKE